MWRLEPVPFSQFDGWAADNHQDALKAFARHASRPDSATYRRGAIGICPQNLEPLFAIASGAHDARDFFETEFKPCRLVCDDGSRGFVTAFYEPEVAASRKRTDRFRFPFYRRPRDLVAVDDGNRPSGWDPHIRFGRLGERGLLEEYPDRKAINLGWLDGRGLEIAYVEDPADVFFAHVQGSARLNLTDGSVARITYDGKSGHPFTGIGRLLVERGEIDPHCISMAAIRGWLSCRPDKAMALMEENRSYIFFREAPPAEMSNGPVAAAKVPLTAERSLAVDRLLHTFGTPIFVSADDVGGERWSKLMIAQDTGSAITGPVRGDLFMGSGGDAGDRAGAVKSVADFHVLVPKALRNAAGTGAGS
jgi:peptidoglycan lytic transglycosylase A